MKKIITAFIFLLPFTLNAKISVDASVSSSTVSVEDGFSFTIQIKADEQIDSDIKLPDLSVLARDFQIGSQSQSSNFVSKYINGKFISERTKLYKYTLYPLSEGEKTIPPLDIKIGSKIFTTQAITIKAVESTDSSGHGHAQQVPMQKQTNQQQQNIQAKKNNPHFFVKAIPDKTNVYLGEQIIVSYYLFNRARISNLNIVERPSFSGFIKEDLENVTELNFSTQIINGIQYERALLGKYALYPLKTGEAVIDSMAIRALIYSNTKRNDDDDPFGGFGLGNFFSFTRPSEVVRKSKPININVKGLPKQGKPTSYTGAIGDFKIDAKLSSSQGKMGQPVSLIVNITGRGNFSAIQKPSLNLSNDIEVFDSKQTINVTPLGDGELVLEYVLIPKAEGKFNIGPVAFCFFDSETKEYKTINTKTYTLVVQGGIAPLSPASSNFNTQSLSEPKSIATDIRYIKTSGGKNFCDLINNKLYYLAYFLVIAVLVLFYLIFIKQKKLSVKELAKNKADNFLKMAQKTNDSEQVIKYCIEAILSIIAGVLNTSYYGEKHEDLLNKYQQVTGKTELVEEIKKILAYVYKIRYSGNEFLLKEKDQFMNTVSKLIKRIDSN